MRLVGKVILVGVVGSSTRGFSPLYCLVGGLGGPETSSPVLREVAVVDPTIVVPDDVKDETQQGLVSGEPTVVTPIRTPIIKEKVTAGEGDTVNPFFSVSPTFL